MSSISDGFNTVNEHLPSVEALSNDIHQNHQQKPNSVENYVNLGPAHLNDVTSVQNYQPGKRIFAFCCVICDCVLFPQLMTRIIITFSLRCPCIILKCSSMQEVWNFPST
jgi:hypothetical protein